MIDNPNVDDLSLTLLDNRNVDNLLPVKTELYSVEKVL